MRLANGFDEAQAEAETALRAARVATKQPFPDAWDLLGWNARSGVAHAQYRASFVTAQGHVDATARRGVLDCVVDQVCRHLLQTRTVTIDDDVADWIGDRRCRVG